MRDESGATAVLGEVLAVAIVVAGVTAAAGFMLASVDAPDAQASPELRALVTCGADGWGDGDERVLIRHAGGPAIRLDQVRILVTVNGQPINATDSGMVLDERLVSGMTTSDFADITPVANASSYALGSGWVSGTEFLLPDHDVRFTIVEANGLQSHIAHEGTVDAFLCPSAGQFIAGALQSGFGNLPFIDRDCDGVREPGDELLETSDFDDGHFSTPFGECLRLPAGSGDITAEDILLETPGGDLTVEVNLTATLGAIILNATGGSVTIGDVDVQSLDDVHIIANDVDLQLADITSDEGGLIIEGNGTVDLSGATIRTGGLLGPADDIPVIDLPDQTGEGSIRFCVAILDVHDHVTSGWQFHNKTLAVAGRDGPDYMSQEGVLPRTNFTTPLSLNADLFLNDGINDGQCVTYNDLSLGGWFYDDGLMDNTTGWQSPILNDQNVDTIETFTDFFPYSPELFDGDPSNDDERDSNADGHIVLNSGRPFRTIAVLFRSLEERQAEVSISSNGGDIILEDVDFTVMDSDIVIDSGGGDILASRLDAEVLGVVAQIRMYTDGGLLQLRNAALDSASGFIVLDAQAGDIDLRTGRVVAAQNLELDMGGMDLNGANITSEVGDIIITAVGPTTIDQSAADIADRDGTAVASPGGSITLVGSPASGSITLV